MANPLFKEIEEEFERKRDKNKRSLITRQNKIYKMIPKVKEIDDKIKLTSLKMAKEILSNPDDNEKIVQKTKEEIDKLKMEKAYILSEANIPIDYLELKYDCDECKDTGYLEDGNKCHCLMQSLINRAYKMSNLETILEKENFKNFDINVFSNEPFEDEKLTPRENMLDILSIAESFVADFDKPNAPNLLFYGTTGLGKTYLCSCIAKALLDKNKIVIYQTAFTILELLSNRRFRAETSEMSEFEYNLLFECDLLIIDDLGTEITNTFTNAEIFNIVNTRILKNKKTIISTNLTPNELSSVYTDRVFSRISDKFLPLKFFGKDLRWE